MLLFEKPAFLYIVTSFYNYLDIIFIYSYYFSFLGEKPQSIIPKHPVKTEQLLNSQDSKTK